MSTSVDAQQVRRWQDEVARDPGSPAFVPLAEMYRRDGKLEVARRLCIRGLERQPEHVDAHALLGRIYRDAGDLERAFDELDIALRLDPAHRTARRAIGYLCLERRDWKGAVRHLEEAARQDPADQRVASALALARGHAGGPAGAPDPAGWAGSVTGSLEAFVRDTRVRLVLLLEGSGKIVAQHGFTSELDMAAFATLGAGIHSASRALAQLLGQRAFEQLYQGQGERQLFLGPLSTPAGEMLLLTVFGTDTTIGLVRVHFDELAREVAALAPSPRSAPRDAAAFEGELAAGLQRALAGPLDARTRVP